MSKPSASSPTRSLTFPLAHEGHPLLVQGACGQPMAAQSVHTAALAHGFTNFLPGAHLVQPVVGSHPDGEQPAYIG